MLNLNLDFPLEIYRFSFRRKNYLIITLSRVTSSIYETFPHSCLPTGQTRLSSKIIDKSENFSNFPESADDDIAPESMNFGLDFIIKNNNVENNSARQSQSLKCWTT